MNIIPKKFKIFFLIGVCFLLHAPLLVLVVESFNRSGAPFNWQGFSVSRYSHFFQNRFLMKSIGNSILLAGLSSITSTFLGYISALTTHRYRFSGYRVVMALLFAAMLAPDMVTALSQLFLFRQLGLQLGFKTLFIAHTSFSLPYAAFLFQGQMKNISPDLLEAAKDLGAEEHIILLRVLTPLLKPTILASLGLSFFLSFDDVVISTFLGSPDWPILPQRLYSMGRSGTISEISTLGTITLGVNSLAAYWACSLFSEAAQFKLFLPNKSEINS